MDLGRLNYLRHTEGNMISKGECSGDSVTKMYKMSKKILSEVLGHYKDYSKFIDLQQQNKRVGGKSFSEFQYLIEKRVDRIKGEKKLERIESHIDNSDFINAVKEILR